MAKRVNVSSMSDSVLHMFSDYNVADIQLEIIGERFKAEKAGLEAERDEALENGDDTTAAVCMTKIKALEAATAEEKKPYMEQKRAAMKLFPSVMYDAYVVAMKKGDVNATGFADIESKKNGRVTFTRYEVSKDHSFRNCMRDFMKDAGMYSPSDNATDKHVTAMLLACGGMTKSNYLRTGRRASVKSERQFDDLVVRVYLDTFIDGNGAFDIAPNGAIFRVKFEEDENK